MVERQALESRKSIVECLQHRSTAQHPSGTASKSPKFTILSVLMESLESTHSRGVLPMTSQGKTLDSVILESSRHSRPEEPSSQELSSQNPATQKRSTQVRLPQRASLGRGTQAILGQLLRTMYGELLTRPVPDRLLAIVSRIEDHTHVHATKE